MLLTAKEYILYRHGSKSGTDKIDGKRVESFIATAQSLVSQHCCRVHDTVETLETPASAITEEFSGDNTNEYIVAQGRIATGSAIALTYWSGSAWVTHSGTLEVNTRRTAVRFTSVDMFAKCGRYRLTYKPGYTAAEAPAHLKQCLCQLTHRLILKADGKEGLTSESFGDHSTSYDLNDIPKDVARDLARYKVDMYG